MPAGPRPEESQRVLSAMEAADLSHQTMGRHRADRRLH
jgi:hypothetical protein